jgi:hypothetical protein
MWQWLGLILVAITTTIHSAVQGRTIGFWGAMPNNVLYEPAAVYGLVIGAPLYAVVCWVGALVAIDRKGLGRLQRVPEVFGLQVHPGRPLAKAVPLFWLILYVGLPTFSLGHFARKFLEAYPRSCWIGWRDAVCTEISHDGQYGIDIVPGVQPLGIAMLLLLAAAALGAFVRQLTRRPQATTHHVEAAQTAAMQQLDT